jgi:Cu/Ag efflux protein CusF
MRKICKKTSKKTCGLIAALALAFGVNAATAQSSMSQSSMGHSSMDHASMDQSSKTQSPMAQSSMVSGHVVKVDASAKKITIKHGPLARLDMEEGMTMVYAAPDPSMLAAVKAGDNVKFDAERVNGQLTITKIEKTK